MSGPPQLKGLKKETVVGRVGGVRGPCRGPRSWRAWRS